jgi:hypothetical protein
MGCRLRSNLITETPQPNWGAALCTNWLAIAYWTIEVRERSNIMQYRTIKEREALYQERIELALFTMRYSIIGGVLVWVLYNL